MKDHKKTPKPPTQLPEESVKEREALVQLMLLLEMCLKILAIHLYFTTGTQR